APWFSHVAELRSTVSALFAAIAPVLTIPPLIVSGWSTVIVPPETTLPTIWRPPPAPANDVIAFGLVIVLVPASRVAVLPHVTELRESELSGPSVTAPPTVSLALAEQFA